jgi:tRNA A58 N-methylase Trm61
VTDEKKFDPARAHVLDAPERERHLPTGVLVEALAPRGGERVVDYGAGTGRLALAVAGAQNGGELVAVEENETMYEHPAAAVVSTSSCSSCATPRCRCPTPGRTGCWP